MHINTKTSYGLRLMLHLALNYGKGQVFLKEIARQEGISEKYLGQIVMPLKASGFVSSVRGARGGYMLSEPPSKVSVWDVVGALEGELNFSKQNGNFSSQSKTFSCINTLVWKKLERSVSDTLESVTLADLVTAYAENDESGIMYTI